MIELLRRYLLENINSQFGLQQAIKEPTYIPGHSASCIDLQKWIFSPKYFLTTLSKVV